MLLKFKNVLANFRDIFNKNDDKTLGWITKKVISYNNYKPFKFVEIGVFKGDNALEIISLAQKFNVKVHYVGFDLFEDMEDFFASHPADRELYDTEEYPYWEFKSGKHALEKVTSTISSTLATGDFSLIKGDSTITVPAHINELYNASIIYIDGCHDYDIVSKDWENVAQLIKANPDVVIVFDDQTYEGVYQVKKEIEAIDFYKVFTLNSNQFFVVSKKSKFAQIFRWYRAAS